MDTPFLYLCTCFVLFWIRSSILSLAHPACPFRGPLWPHDDRVVSQSCWDASESVESRAMSKAGFS